MWLQVSEFWELGLEPVAVSAATGTWMRLPQHRRSHLVGWSVGWERAGGKGGGRPWLGISVADQWVQKWCDMVLHVLACRSNSAEVVYPVKWIAYMRCGHM